MNNKQNFQSLDEILGLNITFDIVKRTITNHNNLVFTFYYDSFLSNSLTISRLITSFIKLKDKIDENNIKDVITNNLIAENLKFTSNLTDASQAVFNGDLVLTCDITPLMFIAETKQYPSRSISEPDGEKVVRGSRDGFTENFATNIGLIRRRIKTGKLGMKVYELGTVSKTKGGGGKIKKGAVAVSARLPGRVPYGFPTPPLPSTAGFAGCDLMDRRGAVLSQSFFYRPAGIRRGCSVRLIFFHQKRRASL